MLKPVDLYGLSGKRGGRSSERLGHERAYRSVTGGVPGRAFDGQFRRGYMSVKNNLGAQSRKRERFKTELLLHERQIAHMRGLLMRANQAIKHI